MNHEELKEYFERDMRYRERIMKDAVSELIMQVDFLKSDLVKNEKRLKAGDVSAFQMIKSDMTSYVARFNVEKLETITREWDKSNEVVKALKHLEENKEEEKK